jgi:hypothetical protein
MINKSVYSMAAHFSYRSEGTQKAVTYNVFDLPDGALVAAALYFTLDAHKRHSHEIFSSLGTQHQRRCENLGASVQLSGGEVGFPP